VSDSERSARARLMALEFRHALHWGAWLDAYRRSGLTRRLSGCWLWAVALPVFLWLLLTCGAARSELVAWRDVPVTPVSVLAWLLWALAGIIVAGAALLTGWLNWDNRYILSQGLSGPPVTGALPLHWRSVVTAKLAGRGAAFGVQALAVFGMLAIARLIMVAANLVTAPPSLIDPWFIGAMMLQVAMMIASVRIASAARWGRTGLATQRFVAFVLLGIGGMLLASRVYPVASGVAPWSVGAMILPFTGVVALALLQALPAVRRLERRLLPGPTQKPLPEGIPTTPAQARTVAFGDYLAMATRGLGGMRGRRTAWLLSLVVFAARTVAICVIAGFVIQAIALTYAAIAAVLQPASGQQLDPFVLDFFGTIPAAAFTLAIGGAGIALWPEASAGYVPWAGRSMAANESRRSIGDTLPVAPSRVWRERLLTLPLVWLVMAAGGVATLLVLQYLRAAIDPNVPLAEALRVSPTFLVTGVAVAATFSLVLFIITPMLHRARKALPLPIAGLGCLGWAAFIAGVMTPVLVTISLDFDHGFQAQAHLSQILGIMLLVWLAVGLPLSRQWWDPASWPVDADGALSTGAVARAIFAYAFALLGALLSGSVIWTIVGIVH